MNIIRNIYRELGFTGLLTIVFFVLKLTGVAGWTWWLVLSPIPIVLFSMVSVAAVEIWLKQEIKHDDWWDTPYKGTGG